MSRHVLMTLVVMLAAIGLGCKPNTVPLTSELIEEYKLLPLDLKRLQYYVSDSVEMERQVSKSEVKRVGGGLKWKRDRYVHVVEIPKDLPGIAESSSKGTLGISFKVGSTFYFALSADRGGKFYMTPDRIGDDGFYIYTYEGYEYSTYCTDGVHLLVELDGLSKFRKEREQLKGRRISN